MSKKGFTLIELLIVVAIIGILTGIAVPMYRDVTVKAEISKSLSELRSMRADAVFGHGKYRDTELRVAGYDGIACIVEKIFAETNSSKIVMDFLWPVHMHHSGATLLRFAEKQDYYYVWIHRYKREGDCSEWTLVQCEQTRLNPSVKDIFELYLEIRA